MDIEYRTNKIKKQCEDPALAQRAYGKCIGSKLTQRVTEMVAAVSLEDIKNIPCARLHKLKGDRAEQYAVDLVHPFRLIIKPIYTERMDNVSLSDINHIRIEEVTDYHGKNR